MLPTLLHLFVSVSLFPLFSTLSTRSYQYCRLFIFFCPSRSIVCRLFLSVRVSGPFVFVFSKALICHFNSWRFISSCRFVIICPSQFFCSSILIFVILLPFICHSLFVAFYFYLLLVISRVCPLSSTIIGNHLFVTGFSCSSIRQDPYIGVY